MLFCTFWNSSYLLRATFSRRFSANTNCILLVVRMMAFVAPEPYGLTVLVVGQNIALHLVVGWFDVVYQLNVPFSYGPLVSSRSSGPFFSVEIILPYDVCRRFY